MTLARENYFIKFYGKIGGCKINKNIIQVFDINKNRIAFLQNAFNIGYKKFLNSLWTAHFSLPADDYKNKFCKPFNYIEIYDGEERVELFRIVGEDLTRSNQGVKVYSCEHCLATLIDDVLFKYHQIGNLGVYTKSVIRYILNHQSENNWKLGICDFNHQFEYKFESENLLSSLLSVSKPFETKYIWDFDTTVYPWVINLKKLNSEIRSEIRYGKNMTEVIKNTDATSVITRLYPLGFGEGDNQLGIDSINNNIPYLEAPTITTWGVKASVLADRRFEDAKSLKAYAQNILNEAKNPYVSYSVKAVDLYKISKQVYAKFKIGDLVKIIDLEDDINVIFPIIEISKSDITGNPVV